MSTSVECVRVPSRDLITHSDLYYLIQARARSLQNGLCVLAHLVCLFSDSAFNKPTVRLGWNLTREENQAVCLDRL